MNKIGTAQREARVHSAMICSIRHGTDKSMEDEKMPFKNGISAGLGHVYVKLPAIIRELGHEHMLWRELHMRSGNP